MAAGSSRKGNFQREGENFSTSINSSSHSGGNDNDTGFMTGTGAGSGTGGKEVDAASTNEIFQRALEEGGRVVYGVKHDVDLASSSSQGFEEIARKHRAIAVQVGHYHTSLSYITNAVISTITIFRYLRSLPIFFYPSFLPGGSSGC